MANRQAGVLRHIRHLYRLGALGGTTDARLLALFLAGPEAGAERGPRRGACFRLARWMEDHHGALEKDYVIVKVMEGLDDHASDVIEKLPITHRGIPWHAITEPDGTILITCGGPLGNIGFPAGSIEGVRHLRRMLERTAKRLTSDDVDRLVKSLSPEK